MTKLTYRLLASAFASALLAGTAFAQSITHSGHDMGHMDHDAIMEARSQHMVEAIAVVSNVNKRDRIVSLAHKAIPAISWPAMTMKFPVGKNIDLNGLKKGQAVQFTLHRAEDGSLPLVELCPAISSDVIAGLCAHGMNHGPQSDSHPNKSHGHMNH